MKTNMSVVEREILLTVVEKLLPRVATAYSADKYKEHNEQYKSAE